MKHGVPFSRILLVDDDVLELERAKARGLQVYAAPEDGAMACHGRHGLGMVVFSREKHHKTMGKP